ncbi:MAG TPA: DUF6755 family protein [Planctomycetota bacterium]|nr:DUF6755 family protein [Planctomycetota bacterium]
MHTQRQGITLFTAILALIATLVIIQLWLVTAALDGLLSGEVGVALPGAIASFVLFLANGGLLLHALRFDRRLQRGRSHGER